MIPQIIRNHRAYKTKFETYETIETMKPMKLMNLQNPWNHKTHETTKLTELLDCVLSSVSAPVNSRTGLEITVSS